MTVPVEQVDLSLAHVPTAVKRVPRSSVIVVEPDHVDRYAEPLFDLREVNRTNRILNRIEPVLREVCIRVK